MWLQNVQKAGRYHYRVVLDNAELANFVERTKGVYYDEVLCKHRCLNCMSVVNWWDWTKNNKRAKATCNCGANLTLEYLITFDFPATPLA